MLVRLHAVILGSSGRLGRLRHIRREHALARLRFELDDVPATVRQHHDVLLGGLARERQAWRQDEFDVPAGEPAFHFLPIFERKDDAKMPPMLEPPK